MKAAQISAYGGPEVIQISSDVVIPTPKQGQVLVDVYSSTVNPIDWKIRAGYLQKMAPLPFPFTIGGDFAGKITDVGEGVIDFKVGDEVFGTAIVLGGGSGSLAEYLVTNSISIAPKPKTASFEESGALPLVGVSSLQALEEHIKLQQGQKILIHGGAGGIGHIAIQLAKSIGAYVATTAKKEDTEFVKGLGADEVIDFKTEKFEEKLKDFDAVYDTVGGETTNNSFKVLKKGGVLVSMAGAPNPELAAQYGVTAIGQMTQINTLRLTTLASLVESGKIKVHIAKEFPLEQVQQAFTFQETSHPQGKVVIKIKE